MGTKQVSQVIITSERRLVAYADIAFDSATGLSVECWEVFEAPVVLWRGDRNALKTFKLDTLSHEDLKTATDAIYEMCENALLNEDIYAELEREHAEHYNEYLLEDR